MPRICVILIACIFTIGWQGSVMSEEATEFKGGTEADYAAMQALLMNSIGAYNESDPEKFKSAYTEDAWQISMRRPIKKTREGIGAAFTPGMSKYLFASELEVLDIEVHDDIAYMISRTTLTGEPRDGAAVPSFVEERINTIIYKRQSGKWLIHRFMEGTSPREGEPSTIPTD